MDVYDTVEDSLILGDSLNSIENEAKNLLSENEANTILVTSSIAYKSKIYWNENFDEWESAIINYLDNNSVPKRSDFAAIGEADITGAVGGAVTSLITGCAQLSLGACLGWGALAGGLGASAAEAVGQLIDWLWG